jgi:hypothetical protein
MKKRLLAWLLRHLRDEIEAQLRAEAARLVEQLELRLDQKATEPLAEATRQFHQQPQPRKFIGQ